jgi:hypothetical protein
MNEEISNYNVGKEECRNSLQKNKPVIINLKHQKS